MVGSRVGHFKIEAQLGRGGMGVVYRALDEKLHRMVALKFLPAEWAADPSLRARLLREARAAAVVTHRNVATVYEVGEEAEHVFLALELIEGRSLRAVLQAGRPALDEALRIAREIARGVAKAHEKGIVHRDLKPENVMISDEGEVKVLDFGLARQIDAVDADKTKPSPKTRTGEIVGTPAYMSPEQATGRPVDARSDVFSLGVVLYELTAGKHPFQGDSVLEVAMAIVRDAPPPPSSVNAAISPALERIINTCLAKAPRERYSTAKDLLRDLEILAAQPSGTAVRVAPSRGRRGRWIAGLVGAAALAAGVALWSQRTPQVAPPAPQAESAAVGSRPLPLSSNPEAVRFYLEGLQARREQRTDDAERDFKRAIERDPTMGPALLRLALAQPGWISANDESRGFFRRASAHRASLDERDQGLLDAWEPVFQRQPADEAEALKRLRLLAQRYPRDVEIAVDLAAAALASADVSPEAQLAYATTATRIDPRYADAWSVLVQAQLRLGDVKGVMSTIEQCLTGNPAAVACLHTRANVRAAAGEYQAAEEDARRVLTVEPEGFGNYTLANALLGQRGREAAVRELLRRGWLHIPEEGRAAQQVQDEAVLAIRDGDFVTAIKRLRTFADLIKDASEEEPHAQAAYQLASVLEETGQLKEAGKVATTFLARRDGWEPLASRTEEAIVADPTGLLLSVAYRAGALTAEQFAEQRKARADWWQRRLGKDSWLRYYVWEVLYAVGVRTPDEARHALEVLPRFGRRYALSVPNHDDAAHGRTDLLAGQVDAAIRQLDHAAKGALWFGVPPIEHVRAWYFLGEARAEKGDRAGACAAYGNLLERWGKARPRSVTAEKARRRRAELGCRA